MSTQNDLLNGSNNKNESLASEGPEHTKMCSNWQDDSDNMFPYYEDDTRGDSLLVVEESLILYGLQCKPLYDISRKAAVIRAED
jgi:hypothetical protein